MKDVAAPMRAGYITKLSSLSVGVYDQMLPPGKSDTSYILLTTQTQGSERTKDRFEPICSIIVDINVRTGAPTGKLQCDRIANEVLRLICPLRKADFIDLGDDFECATTEVLQNETMHDMFDTGHSYRRIIRFQHKVLEK